MIAQASYGSLPHFDSSRNPLQIEGHVPLFDNTVNPLQHVNDRVAAAAQEVRQYQDIPGTWWPQKGPPPEAGATRDLGRTGSRGRSTVAS